MGREIKFRGYKKLKKVMVYNFPIEAHAPYGIDDAFKLLAENENKIAIMQYTGLKDKNGKEIYEGDVVKNEQGEIASIIFSDSMGILSGFTFRHKELPIYDFETEDDNGYKVILFELIGNIYENPNLIV